MADLAVIGIVAVIMMASISYIRKQKKKGAVCIGCSSCQGGCACHKEDA